MEFPLSDDEDNNEPQAIQPQEGVKPDSEKQEKGQDEQQSVDQKEPEVNVVNKEKVAQIENEMKEKEEQIAQLNNEITESRLELYEMKTLIEEHKSKIADLEAKIQNDSEKFEDFSKQIEEKSEEIKKLTIMMETQSQVHQEEMTKVQEQNNSLTNEINVLQQSLESLNTNLTNEQANNESLQESIQQASFKISELEAQMMNQQAELQSEIQKQQYYYVGEFQKCQDKVELTKQEIEQKSQEILFQQNQIEQMNNYQVQAQEENTNLQSQIAFQAQQYQQSQKEFERIIQQNEAEIKQLKANGLTQDEELSKYMQELEQRNVQIGQYDYNYKQLNVAYQQAIEKENQMQLMLNQYENEKQGMLQTMTQNEYNSRMQLQAAQQDSYEKGIAAAQQQEAQRIEDEKEQKIRLIQDAKQTHIEVENDSIEFEQSHITNQPQQKESNPIQISIRQSLGITRNLQIGLITPSSFSSLNIQSTIDSNHSLHKQKIFNHLQKMKQRLGVNPNSNSSQQQAQEDMEIIFDRGQQRHHNNSNSQQQQQLYQQQSIPSSNSNQFIQQQGSFPSNNSNGFLQSQNNPNQAFSLAASYQSVSPQNYEAIEEIIRNKCDGIHFLETPKSVKELFASSQNKLNAQNATQNFVQVGLTMYSNTRSDLSNFFRSVMQAYLLTKFAENSNLDNCVDQLISLTPNSPASIEPAFGKQTFSPDFFVEFLQFQLKSCLDYFKSTDDPVHTLQTAFGSPEIDFALIMFGKSLTSFSLYQYGGQHIIPPHFYNLDAYFDFIICQQFLQSLANLLKITFVVYDVDENCNVRLNQFNGHQQPSQNNPFELQQQGQIINLIRINGQFHHLWTQQQAQRYFQG